MTDRRDYVALDWVSGEITESLKLAASALDDYSNDRNDSTKLHFCLAYIHQVQGSLRMVEFMGAALLAETMESVVNLLLEGSLADNQAGDALGALQVAMAELPAYLQQLGEQRRDNPARLIRAFNELLAVRGQPLLSAGPLFAPGRAAPSTEAPLAVSDEEFADVIRKLRQMYQIALLGFLRGHEVRKNLNYLAKVCARVVKLGQGHAVSELWFVCIALLEGLLNNSIKSGVAVRSLLRRMDAEIRRLQEQGKAGLAAAPDTSLLRNLQFYVACSEASSQYIREAKQRFGLAAALPDSSQDIALHQRLSVFLQGLASRLASGETGLSGSVETAARCAAILGLNAPYQTLSRIAASLADGGDAAQLAGQVQILSQQVGSSRDTSQAQGLFNDSEEAQQHLDRAYASVIQESRNGLELAKEALVNFVANQWQTDYLKDVPGLLASLHGSLLLAEFRQAAAVLKACETFIREQLLEDPHVPDWQTLDALADALTSVDYYLERSAGAVGGADEDVLAIARRCVAALGYPIDDAQAAVPEPEAIPAATDIAAAPEPQAPVAPTLVEAEPASVGAEAEAVAQEPEPEPEPAADEVDPEILEIFIEEAEEVLDAINEQLPAWRENLGNKECLEEVRRAFHTLKGSGRMVGAEQVGELGWRIENMLNRVMEGRLQMDDRRLALIEQAMSMAPDMVSAFQNGHRFDAARLAPVLAEAEALAGEQSPAEVVVSAEPPPAETDSNAQAFDEAETAPLAEEPEEDTLSSIFAGEARIHLQAIRHFLSSAQAPAPLSDTLQRSLHTLKGAAHMAEMAAIAELVTPAEKLVKEMRALQLPGDVDLLVLLNDVVTAITTAIGELERGQGGDIPDRDGLLQRIDTLTRRLALAAGARDQAAPRGASAAELDQFIAESGEHFAALQDVLQLPGRLDATRLQLLGGRMGWVADRAEALSLEAIAELAGALRALLGQVRDPVPAALAELASAAAEHLMTQLNQLAGEQQPARDAELLTQLRNFDFAAVADEADIEEIELAAPAEPAPAEAQPSAEPPASAPEAVEADIDPEILGIFQEEAEDLLEAIDEVIHRWSEGERDREQLDELQRHLHTMKGGARLAGLMGLGELTHNFESYIIEQLNTEAELGEDFLSQVLNFQDQLVLGVKAAGQGRDIAAATATPAAPASAPSAPLSEAGGESPSTVSPADRLPEVAAPAETRPAPEKKPERPDAALAELETYTPQEMIKVSAGLMENLVNLAGETSIARGRAEEQVNDFSTSLEEMLITVERLQEQVRRLDLETEAQILFRQEQVESEGQDGFDPLEFDRYSQLQQLSRSLLESASDLTDIRDTLSNKTRDMETLLLQQSRINTELQEGLMRSRMVHFARMVPRLRRIVRQISLEVGKRVEFKVYNAEGELDRQVLERIVPPLEHMLRNAVDHGIESEEQRRAAGKDPVGTISMRFDREGGDVVITLSDDGGGVNLEAIRRKAESQGLLEPGQTVSERQLLDFLFQSGFSTAEKVTQISGRGVGMDVVYSEIKQLGGSVDIETQAGKGTRFLIRLPFTVSVNRALMVSVGGDIYAVPINAIEGIVRVSPYELEVYYQPDAPPFEYAGQSYNLRYLGGLLRTIEHPHLEGQSEPRPVLLVRGGDQATAVQVDSLLGSREIVVKTLGPQFGTVHGLSGATVLGDGSVVIILDVLAMLRADFTQEREGILFEGRRLETERQNLLVMVVDDSVTVRKVTSRLLERQGMDVMLAKDGVDAITQLQEAERLPDIMLLDIEMPRMDGFEVASRVRHTPRLQGIPIIMITSRTGQKHRERAFGLGVNKYLGKPYQELALIQAISEVTGETLEQDS